MNRSIAVAGKGGTGKSTLAALIIQYLRLKKMGDTLAIDADPDSNLGALLGIKPEKTIGELREEVLKEIKNFPAGMSKASYVEAGLHGIIEEAEGFDLITMGRGEGPGCYCYLNNLIRKFYDDLHNAYNWVVIDNEAGLEHISRRTTANIDALIVIVNENPLSFNCAKQIEGITRDIKNLILNKYIVSNMIREDKRERIRQRIEKLDYQYLCDMSFDPRVEEDCLEGVPLTLNNGSPLLNCIEKIIDTIGGKDGRS
jgi:CO dehydrogenase maturation factor